MDLSQDLKPIAAQGNVWQEHTVPLVPHHLQESHVPLERIALREVVLPPSVQEEPMVLHVVFKRLAAQGNVLQECIALRAQRHQQESHAPQELTVLRELVPLYNALLAHTDQHLDFKPPCVLASVLREDIVHLVQRVVYSALRDTTAL